MELVDTGVEAQDNNWGSDWHFQDTDRELRQKLISGETKTVVHV
jgi:hypothetical protein